MSRTLRLKVSSPREERVVEGVLRLRFEGPDGLRGVLPGHEPAVALVLPGVVRVARVSGVHDGGAGERVEHFATEGGFLRIAPDEVRLVTRWLSRGGDLSELAERLRTRARRRRGIDEEARTVAERHELAARKALARLQREVHR